MHIRRSNTHDHAHDRARQLGQAAVEFAIIVPVLIFLLLIAVDFGRLFFTYVQLQNSAREGAAYAAANPTDSAPGGGIWTRAMLEKNSQGQGGEGAVAMAVNCAQGAVGEPPPSPSPIACADAPGGSGPGNTVTVTVTERFSFLTPFVNNLVSDLTLRGSATAAVLGLAATGATNPGGCTAGPASAAFTYTITGKTVTVDANASSPRTGTNAITGYNWDWGDGTDPYLQEGVVFSHTFANLQAYTVSLRVENPCGSLQASQTIDLNPPPTPTPSPNPSGSPAPTPTPSPTPEPSPTPTPSPTAAPTATPGACTMRVDFTFTVNNSNGKVAFTGSSTGQPNPAEWHWSFGHNSATRTVTSGSTTEYDYPKPPKNGNDQYTVSLYGKTGTCQSPTVTKTVTLTGN